jgi:predicted transcriptional regulator
MAVMTRPARLDFSSDEPQAARSVIRKLLSDQPEAARKVYAALAHKVWTLLIERRLDGEVRDWHAVLQAVKAFVAAQDKAMSERMVVLSDLLRESINLAETSPARELAQRPHAASILAILRGAGDYVPRRRLLAELGIGSSHLSNVLTQLVGHSIIERRGKGKEAEFCLTAHGREIMGCPEPEGEWTAGRVAELLRAGIVTPYPETTLTDAWSSTAASADMVALVGTGNYLRALWHSEPWMGNVVLRPTPHRHAIGEPDDAKVAFDRWCHVTRPASHTLMAAPDNCTHD